MSEKNTGKLQKAESKKIENVVTQDKSRRKALLIASMCIGIILIVVIIIAAAALGGSDERLQEQLNLGARYLNEMDYDQALAAFNTALSIEPRNADAHLGIVEVYLKTNEYESALEAAKKGYEVTGDERLKEKIGMIEAIITANELQKLLDLGAQYLEEANYEQALSTYNMALSIVEKNADAYLGIVEVYVRTSEYESALGSAKKGYELTREERLKEKADTIESLMAENELQKQLQEHLSQGEKYLQEMAYDQALSAFDKALLIDPQNKEAHLGIVEAYLGIVEGCLRNEEYESALEAAKKGYEVTGDERLKEKADTIKGIIAANEQQEQLQEQLSLGTQYLEAMDYGQALSALNKALLIDSQNTDARLGIVEAYLGMVESYVQANDYESALKYAKEGYEVTGDERLKEKADAIESIIAAYEQQRRLQEQLSLGAKNLKEMYYDQALAIYNAVLSIDPLNVEAYLGIIEVYIRTNQYQIALEHAKKGYEITGDESFQEKVDMLKSSRIVDSNGWTMKKLAFVSQDSAGKMRFYYFEYTRERVGDVMLEKVYGYYDSKDNWDFRHEIIFDLEGKQARSIAKYNPQGEQEQYLELTYDEKGRKLISYGYFYPGGQLNKTAYAYSDSGYRVTTYNGISDVVEDFSDVETDSEGKELKKTKYNKDGSLDYTTVYIYDNEGNYLGYRNYNANGSLQYEYIKK